MAKKLSKHVPSSASCQNESKDRKSQAKGFTDRQIDRYLYIWFIGEGVVVSDSSQEHLNADDEILYVPVHKGYLSPRSQSHKFDFKGEKSRLRTCSPVATASMLSQSQVCLSEITPTFTRKAMTTACLKRGRRFCAKRKEQT